MCGRFRVRHGERRFKFLDCGVVLVLVILAAVARGQGTPVGELAGQVRDETGALLVGVNVTATSRERGFSRTARSDAAGRFRFAQLQTGGYDVAASLEAFTTVLSRDNLVEVDKRTEIVLTLTLSQQEATVTVTGEVPVLDRTNASLEMRQRQKEFEKMPVARTYQELFLNAPGANLPPNANLNPSFHGAQTSNNLFLFDGVDTTDPTNGQWGSNLDFEAIQEVTVISSGASAEYGRATGGIINVITKSGTNTFTGSGKVILTNDDWNAQNKTRSTTCSTATACTHPSLARTKFDHVNPLYSVTLGGPAWKDHVWFFGAYETADNTSGEQTTAVSLENFRQVTRERFWEGKVTAQPISSVAVSVRGLESPLSGFIINYGNPAELIAYSGQDQMNQQIAGFLTWIFGPNLTAEAQYGWVGPRTSSSTHSIDVYSLGGGVPHLTDDGYYYNGASLVGFTNRPRQGVVASATYYGNVGTNHHSFKVGLDYQLLESASLLASPGNQLFVDQSFDFRTRESVPDRRQDYDPPVATVSKGHILAIYGRDKFEMGPRLSLEVGLRYEHQKSRDDVGRTTVDAQAVSPRFSISFDLSGTGKSLAVGTYGRLYQFINQNFSDSVGQNVQLGSYDNYLWNGTAYAFSNHVAGVGSSTQISSGLDPTHVDEGTVGFRQQIGSTIGVSLTGIYRHWSSFFDDLSALDNAGNRTTIIANYPLAARRFYGVELVVDKRLSDRWNAYASYAWGKTTGNQFIGFFGNFSSLGDYLNSNCRTTADAGVGTGGVIPCAIVTEGPNTTGQPAFSINHNFKALAAYAQSAGPVHLTLGFGGFLSSGIHYQKQRIVNVLIPGMVRNAGPTETYFYEPRGAETTPWIYRIDTSLEAVFPIQHAVELGVKGEIFNVTDVQRQINVNNLNWCDDAAAAPTTQCAISRATFGTATARGSFQAPRNYRLTALVRF